MGKKRDRVKGMWKAFVPVLFFLCRSLATPLSAADSIAILPEKFTLDGDAGRQQLIVEKSRNKLFVGQVTNDLGFSVSDTNIVRIDAGVVLPITNGVAIVEVKWGGETASAEVTVTNTHKPFNGLPKSRATRPCQDGLQFEGFPECGRTAKRIRFLFAVDDEGDFLAIPPQLDWKTNRIG
jgi:hypothetical protein